MIATGIGSSFAGLSLASTMGTGSSPRSGAELDAGVIMETVPKVQMAG